MKLRATRLTSISHAARVVAVVASGISASAAYSLRKIPFLSNTYSGSAIRVRRSSDNLEEDIGFTGAGDLNTTALLSFVGGASGFVTTWYDQSGNGRNAVQANGARQARIVNAGVVETLGGKPAPTFGHTAGQASSYTITFNDTTLRDWSEVGVVRSAFATLATNGNRLPTITDTATSRMGMSAFDSNSLGPTWSASSTVVARGSSAGSTAAQVLTGRTSVETTDDYLNGTLVATCSGVQSSRPTFSTLGSRFSQDSNWFQGQIAEWMFFPSFISTPDRQTLERNQGTYYGISVN